MDKDGKSINPKECAINRRDLRVEIIPPIGKEIYSVCLFTREIEHAMVVDNTTDFADTIFDPVLQQRQSVFKLKTTRTANWSGKLLTEGFIVNNDELIQEDAIDLQKVAKYLLSLLLLYGLHIPPLAYLLPFIYCVITS